MIDRKHKSRKQIIIENNNFDWWKFYKNRNKNTGAVIVITPSQAIYNYSSVLHKYDVEDIYRCLYPGFKQFDLLNDWSVSATSYGNIIIRACVEYESMIYIPPVINIFQYHELLKISGQINEIGDYISVAGMSFGLVHDSNDVVVTAFLESIINLLKNSNRIELDMSKQFYNENEFLLETGTSLKR